jgi:predicted metal-dependent hydrolase
MPYKEFDVSGIGKIKIYKRRNNRSLRLTVAGDGAVKLTMPFWTPYQVGLAFMKTKQDWIAAQSLKRSKPFLNSGEKIGKYHHLIFRASSNTAAIRTLVKQTEVIVSYGINYAANDTSVQEAARTACTRALKDQASRLLPQRLDELSKQHGLDYTRVSIKKMKSRWGSCDQHKNLVLNLYLVQLPWELIDYVIRHELTHTKVLAHGPKFWAELETIEPGARKLRKNLKAYHPAVYIA